jgi:GTP cyclohydrolase I
MATRSEALLAVRTLISYIGEDPDAATFADTPERVVKAWEQDWGRGYLGGSDALVKLFDQSDTAYGGMLACTDINFWSTCAHHMVPFHGKASVAYIPSAEGIVGLSKLARIVTHFACKLQVQEKLTTEIADFIEVNISGDVGVVLTARHLCMESRGVHQPNVVTTTSELRGAFYDDKATRNEFLQLIRGGR